MIIACAIAFASGVYAGFAWQQARIGLDLEVARADNRRLRQEVEHLEGQ
jgi:hypothetical protein